MPTSTWTNISWAMISALGSRALRAIASGRSCGGGRESKHLAAYRQYLLERLQDETTLDRHEQAYLDALDACSEQLPEHSANVVRLRYTNGLTFEQIAAELATTKSAVEKLLSRVRLALRDCIEARLAQA